MGHKNRHRQHGEPPSNASRNRNYEKTKVENSKRRKRRRKIARARDRRREKHITQEFGYNTYHMCTSKMYYCSRERVGEAMIRVEAVYGTKCYGYHCPLCGGWHITTHDCGNQNEVFCVDSLRGVDATV